ncbi:MAG: formate/nitrite transporter family protein [Frankiaceae bacterium]
MTQLAHDVEQPAGEGQLEPRLERAFDHIVEEGEHRLHRDWRALLATSTVAGIDVVIGILALLAVHRATGSALLGGLAFSIGFLALLLGHSELFTEGFLVPITAVAAKRATVRDLGRLWGGTLAGNLLGGWVMAWIVMRAYPQLHAEAVEVARPFAESAWDPNAFALAVVAGAAITLMTRMQQGTDSMPTKVMAAVAGAFLLAGLQMFHSVLDSLLCFLALTGGHAPYGYAEWAHWFGLAVVGNVVGGVVLVTMLRIIRSHQRIVEERRHNGGAGRALGSGQ